MKNLDSSILIFCFLFFITRTNSEKFKDKLSHMKNFDYETDPSSIMPKGVDLERLKFINDQDKNQFHQEENEDNQYFNLVILNKDKASILSHPLSLKLTDHLKSSPNEINSDSSKSQNFNQLPTIVVDNFYSNDLTKKDKINLNNLLDEQAYSNYLSGADQKGLLKNLKQLIPNLDRNTQQQIDEQIRHNIKIQIDKSNQRQINKQNSIENLNEINQLDSKINLNDVLDQLNVLMGSNEGFIRRKQRRLIRRNPGILAALDKGLKLSLSECKYQFKDHHWNCPVNRKLKGREMFGKILNRACRETAYLTAIRSAGIAYAITKDCSNGLIRTCNCDFRLNVNYFSDVAGQSLFKRKAQYSFLQSNNPNELGYKLGIDGIGGNAIQIKGNSNQEYTSDFKWSGCSDNIRFAFKKVKQLLDSHLKSSSSSTQDKILVHNYEAGRMAVKENMILVCKCHGVSGTCTLRTCWRRLSSFRRVSSYLKDRYNNAVQVMSSNDGESLIAKEENISPSTSLDLYYSDSSPDFCSRNFQEGSFGTKGRQCELETSGNLNSCDQLCCGRGFKKVLKIIKSSCNCQFQWCCEIKCDQCKKCVYVYECK